MKEIHQKAEGIAAISGGPDSMAMLGLLLEEGKHPVVAHVNYHARETADRDETLVRSFCEKNGLIFEKKDVKHEPKNGNFQNWARDVRYAFFEELAEKYGCSVLYIGHQKDDCIETWLMQKERGLIPVCYGLEAESRRKNLLIKRPVLSMTKKDCENWCADHGIVWGLDESNLGDHYRRNQIRHSLLENMDDEKKNELIRQIKEDNKALQERRKHAFSVLKACRDAGPKGVPADFSPLLQEEDAWFILDALLSALCGRHFSAAGTREMVSQLKSGSCHFRIEDSEGNPWNLERYAGRLTLQKEPPEVLWRFGSLEALKRMTFYAKSGEAILRKREEGDPLIDCLWLTEDDFPVTLRTAKSSDQLQLRFGTKKLQRHFIDRKMNRVQRRQCLVVENNRKEIVFASTLGCDVQHFENGTAFCLSRMEKSGILQS